MNNELLEVARLGKTTGLKGGLRLHNTSDFPSQYKKGAKFYLKNGEILEILNFNKTTSSVIFKGYEDVDLANTLVNEYLYATISQTKAHCKLQKDEYFYFDILGCEICENDEILGTVEDISESGTNYLFYVKTATNLAQNGLPKEFFVPYIDEYVEKISISEKKIYTKNAKAILENS